MILSRCLRWLARECAVFAVQVSEDLEQVRAAVAKAKAARARPAPTNAKPHRSCSDPEGLRADQIRGALALRRALRRYSPDDEPPQA